MKKTLADPTLRWILALAAAIVVCIGGLSLLNACLPKEADAQAVTLMDVPEPNMRMYASVQVQTGIPWVLLCAVDRAEDFVPDLARVQAVAQVFVDAGAVQRGLTIAPITNAADPAGLYTTDRKAIARIARQVLALQDIYLMIESGRFPADGATVLDEADGCRITDAREARSPFAGTVESVQEGVVKITCDNGITAHFEGIATVKVQAGDRVRAGETLGETTSFFLSFWYGERWIHPYPYLLLIQN